jgi:hypothetical protein
MLNVRTPRIVRNMESANFVPKTSQRLNQTE